MHIREAHIQDWDAIWPIFQSVVQAGETYAYDPSTTKEQGLALWISAPRKTYVAEVNGHTVATYYLKTNQAGPGAHVCNCGYMVAPQARGQGLASALCEHSQNLAKELGYLAMQFNFVASSNTGAVRLWQKLGFEPVGQLPKAFRHPTLGLVDALVMYKWLADS
ncbi:GNAT family N-acetyltransferase [Halioxenophilus aromaticivorans]|uniref:N-acetyltransferase n=1 Tax=Halioxenophilus aromaticivorans TaxID=1306992 RepID=A0AAV3TXT5_9ALTE